MSNSAMNKKFVQYFNEALAMENAAVDRIQSRIKETPIEQTKQQLQYHLEQTFQQQDRLRNIITKLGGDPTTMKATLPKLMPMNIDTISNTVKEGAKSWVSSESKGTMDAEKELIQTKEDAIIENAEIVSYKMLIHMAQEIGLQDPIPALNKNLQEETAMVNFIMGNALLVLRLMLPKLGAPDAR
ncbi:MAG: ferritin-like domain-containing protein [Thermoproteota archaeon]|nr:ferritin-like domain-containing protein [Thermoproteota archaeon]